MDCSQKPFAHSFFRGVGWQLDREKTRVAHLDKKMVKHDIGTGFLTMCRLNSLRKVYGRTRTEEQIKQNLPKTWNPSFLRVLVLVCELDESQQLSPSQTNKNMEWCFKLWRCLQGLIPFLRRESIPYVRADISFSDRACLHTCQLADKWEQS